MRIAIVGAGLLGVASAYYLAKEGHEVLVLDRQSAPARETSFANASLLTPNHSFSWAAPGAPWLLLKSLWQADSGLRLKPHMNSQLLDWGLRFLRNCTPGRHRANTLAKTRLCFYAMAELERVTAETGIGWQRGTQGVLYLFRDRHELELADKDLALLREAGAAIAPISWDEVVALEPGLEHARSKFVGALHGTSDEVGDARRFTEALAESCRARGVTFRLSTTIDGLEVEGDRVTALKTSSGPIKADAFVLAAGSYSPLLARDAGLFPEEPLIQYRYGLSLYLAGEVDKAETVFEKRRPGRRHPGRVRAAGRSRAHDVGCGSRRLRHQLSSRGFRENFSDRARIVPRRHRARSSGALGLPAPGDARRAAHHRPKSRAQSVA
jgi:glycine/D-amino acid oxidase-like deaminating enzyme